MTSTYNYLKIRTFLRMMDIFQAFLARKLRWDIFYAMAEHDAGEYLRWTRRPC